MKKVTAGLLIAGIAGTIIALGVTALNKPGSKASKPSTNSIVATWAQGKIGSRGTVAKVACKDVSKQANKAGAYACTVLVSVTGAYANACEGVIVQVNDSKVTAFLYGKALAVSSCGQK